MNTQKLGFGKWFALIAVMFSFGAFAGSLRAQATPTPYDGVTIVNSTPKEEVQSAIIAILGARGWTITEKTDGKVVATLKHRANEATVTLTYDTSKIEISSVGYQINKKTGEREKPERPRGWLKFIRQDLLKRFNPTALDK